MMPPARAPPALRMAGPVPAALDLIRGDQAVPAEEHQLRQCHRCPAGRRRGGGPGSLEFGDHLAPFCPDLRKLPEAQVDRPAE